jgi:YT521-B-like domain
MASSIDDTVTDAESPLPRPTPSHTAPVDNSITVPTPATEHAPKGYIIDDSARGTVFWEAESGNNTETQDPEDEAATSTAETADSDLEQQSLGHPFKIEWISTAKFPFHRARGLRNPLNQNREVKIARDGTEIEPSVGRRLISLFHTAQATAHSPGSHYPYQAVHPPTYPPAYPADPRFGRHF